MERVTHGLYEWSCEAATWENGGGGWPDITLVSNSADRPSPDMMISRLKLRTIMALSVQKERVVRNRGGLKIGEEGEGQR